MEYEEESDDTFTNDEILRGKYSKMAYYITTPNNKISIPALPKINENEEFKNVKWQLKNENEDVAEEINSESTYEITGSYLGTGNTENTYISENDSTNTYHLYLYTKKRTAVDTIVDQITPETKQNLINPKTGDLIMKFSGYGVLGVMLFIIVARIRRKYSRKMKKIQF